MSMRQKQTQRGRKSILSRLATICAMTAMFSSVPMMSSCGGGGSTANNGGGGTTQQTSAPTISVNDSLGGAKLLSFSDSTSGAIIYYTTDGSTPTASSPRYFAPVLLTSNVTVKAFAVASGYSASTTTSQAFAPNIASGTLVWTDDFTNGTGANAAPNSSTWTYDTGGGGYGNNELEIYCSYGSAASPCDAAKPNVYVGTDGYLHIVARNPSGTTYTSARMKTTGLFSINYGRIEARMKLPEGQGLWPAFWMLGNNIATVNWPACGEQDIMEHINAPSPDWIAGSLHGTHADLSTQYSTGTFSATDWHVYGMIWSPQSIKFYVDDPSNVYATFTPSSLSGQTGAVWPFDSNSGAYILLNLAVGGTWPGSPNASTPFPSEMLVDYVHVYTN